MKRFYFMMCCIMFCAIGSAQTNNGNGGTQANAASRTFTTANIYYGDNIIAHVREYGIDLFKEYPSFPKFVDTKNVNSDCIEYRKHIFEWIKKNPDFAKRLNIDMNLLEKEESKF